MTQIVLDQVTLAKLHNLETPLEVCDTSGRVLGYFQPAAAAQSERRRRCKSPFSEEELQRRRQQRTGRPLSEILDRLRQS
jgi:hypothetical protein